MAEKEYIEREEAMRFVAEHMTQLNRNKTPDSIVSTTYEMATRHAVNYLAYVPPADVAEVKHGEWEIKSEIHQMFDDVDEELYVECPFCHRTEYVPFEFDDKKILEYAR